MINSRKSALLVTFVTVKLSNHTIVPDRMRLPSLLWADLTVATPVAELPHDFVNFFSITRLENARHALKRESVRNFDCICFDFDYPDREGLHLMQRIKKKHPSIPITMLTTQHSEALAIWAFRTRIWDYFVKPVPELDLERSLTSLSHVFANKTGQRSRAVYRPNPSLPQEVRLAANSADELALLPAIYYVERNFRKKIRISELAKLCGLSTAARFSRAFHSSYGLTFQDYLLRYRIKQACRLLDNPNASIADVSYIVGFNDPSYFARVFRRYIGRRPSEFAAKPKRSTMPELLPLVPGNNVSQTQVFLPNAKNAGEKVPVLCSIK